MSLQRSISGGYEFNSNRENLSYCKVEQPENPYCGIFGPAEIVEVIVLVIFTVCGTLGNLLVIASIIYEKRVHKQGNIFIINLAAADLIVCGFFLPTVIANVIKTENALPTRLCQFAGYLVTVTCACSVCNLAFIALNRYWSVSRHQSYHVVFSKRNSILMVLFTWIWSNLIVSPTLFGWSRLIYDYKMAECGWDDCISRAYNIVLMVFSIFVPVSVIIVCYLGLFKSVRDSRRRMKKLANPRSISARNKNAQRFRQELSLLKTLAVIVLMFVISWLPYGIVVLFFSGMVPPRVKKAAARLGLSNSAMNFIIYGVMNPVFRKRYHKLIDRMFCKGICSSCCNRRDST